jgi:hypothetical protein
MKSGIGHPFRIVIVIRRIIKWREVAGIDGLSAVRRANCNNFSAWVFRQHRLH